MLREARAYFDAAKRRTLAADGGASAARYTMNLGGVPMLHAFFRFLLPFPECSFAFHGLTVENVHVRGGCDGPCPSGATEALPTLASRGIRVTGTGA